MKQLCVFLIIFTISCSKSVDISPSKTQTDGQKNKEHYDPQKTDVYTTAPRFSMINGLPEEFAIPAWDTTLGVLKSWTLTMSSQVYHRPEAARGGDITLTNVLGIQNDNPMNVIVHNTGFWMGASYPQSNPALVMPGDTVSFPQSLAPYEELLVPVNATLTGTLNSTPATLANVYGSAGSTIYILSGAKRVIYVEKADAYTTYINDFWMYGHSSLDAMVTLTISYSYTLTRKY